MTNMSKQEQWKLAAIVLGFMGSHPSYRDEITRDVYAIKALNLIRPTLPWEYPWREVVESLRDRSEAALAKRGK